MAHSPFFLFGRGGGGGSARGSTVITNSLPLSGQLPSTLLGPGFTFLLNCLKGMRPENHIHITRGQSNLCVCQGTVEEGTMAIAARRQSLC